MQNDAAPPDISAILYPSLGIVLVSTIIAILLANCIAKRGGAYSLSDMPA